MMRHPVQAKAWSWWEGGHVKGGAGEKGELVRDRTIWISLINTIRPEGR